MEKAYQEDYNKQEDGSGSRKQKGEISLAFDRWWTLRRKWTQPISGAMHCSEPKVRDVILKKYLIKNSKIPGNEIKKSRQSG